MKPKRSPVCCGEEMSFLEGPQAFCCDACGAWDSITPAAFIAVRQHAYGVSGLLATAVGFAFLIAFVIIVAIYGSGWPKKFQLASFLIGATMALYVIATIFAVLRIWR